MKDIRYADFGLDEYRLRICRLQTAMDMAGLDALIVSDPANLRYLFGFQNLMQLSANRSFVGLFVCDDPEQSTLFIPHDCLNTPHCWTPHVSFWDEGHEPPFDDRMADMNRVAQRLKELRIGRGRVGLEIGAGMRLGMPILQFDQLRQALKEATVVDAAEVLWQLREIKSEAEIEILRRVAAISLEAIHHGIASLREDLTEKQLYCLIYSKMFAEGVDAQGLLCVQFGVDGWQRANMCPTDWRKLQKSDWVYLDGGGFLNGYCADLCRMTAFGALDEKRQGIYDSVAKVTQEMAENIRPGMLCCEVYEMGQQLLEKKGLGAMVDSLSVGHGVGLNVHEMPDLNRHNREPLKAGMVLSLEPWVLDRQQWGLFNKEDMIVVREEGAETLSRD